MAQFKTHMAGGALAAAGISVAALFTNLLTLTQAGAVFMVGFIAGLLPDLDSDTGKPIDIPVSTRIDPDTLHPIFKDISICRRLAGIFNLLFYYFISFLQLHCMFAGKKNHRAQRNDAQSCLLRPCAAQSCICFFPVQEKQIAIIAGLTAFSCCLVHLVLDEFNSIKFKFGFIPSMKQSSGTALKLKSNSALTTIFIYTVLTIIIAGSIVYS